MLAGLAGAWARRRQWEAQLVARELAAALGGNVSWAVAGSGRPRVSAGQFLAATGARL